MLFLIAFVFLLMLALVATQLKMRAVTEQYAAEKVRNDAQRAQFERETRVFQTECESAAAAADARAARWKAVLETSTRLVDQSGREGWKQVAEVLAAAGHFRVVSLRVRDAETHAYVLEHLIGLPDEAVDRLRETRVPDPVVRDWMDARNAFGPGFILRARGLPGAETNAPGSPLGRQDAWLIPFISPEGKVEAYASLAQPEPCRLPDADELQYYGAASKACAAYAGRLGCELDSARSVGRRIKDSQMEAVAMSAFKETLCRVSDRLRSGLANLEGYAQAMLDVGSEMPRGESVRLARVLVDEAQEMREEALLVADLADLLEPVGSGNYAPVEFSDLYAELLQFLLHRAETRGVALSGPPLQGGLYIARPPALLRRLLALVSNELLASCSSGHALSLSAWQQEAAVHLSWRASGAGIKAAKPEDATPRWIAAQAIAHALGGALRESSTGADNRTVSLSIPLAQDSDESENLAA